LRTTQFFFHSVLLIPKLSIQNWKENFFSRTGRVLSFWINIKNQWFSQKGENWPTPVEMLQVGRGETETVPSSHMASKCLHLTSSAMAAFLRLFFCAPSSFCRSDACRLAPVFKLEFPTPFHSFSTCLTRELWWFPQSSGFFWDFENLITWFCDQFVSCSFSCCVDLNFVSCFRIFWECLFVTDSFFLLSSVYLFVYLLLCKWGNSCCLELRGVTGTSKEWRIRAMLVYIVLRVNNLLLSVPSFLSKVRTSQRILTHLQGQFAFYALFLSLSFSVLFSYTRYWSSTTLMLKLSGVGKKLLPAIVNIDDVHGSTTVTNLCNTM
jgi:hypothetical protein